MADASIDSIVWDDLLIKQPTKGYRFNRDSIALARMGAEVMPLNGVGVDLGCGCGVLSLLLLRQVRASDAAYDLRMIGVEIQPALARLAEENAHLNGFVDQFDVLQRDIKELEHHMAADSADFVICNPPYYRLGSGRLNRDSQEAIARHEISATISDFLRLAHYLLKDHGILHLAYPAARMEELQSCLEDQGQSLVSRRAVKSNLDADPHIYFCEIRQGATNALIEREALIYRASDGADTEATQTLFYAV